MPESVPCVVIVGGGFAGLAAARALKKAAVRIIVIDRTNHHLFQPLLYDKGNMAVVGKGSAIMQSGKLKMSGFLAWVAWAAVHLEFLAQPGLQISVFVQWIWTFVTGQRGSRLIVDHTGPGSAKSIPAIASAPAPSSQPPVKAVVSSK